MYTLLLLKFIVFLITFSFKIWIIGLKRKISDMVRKKDDTAKILSAYFWQRASTPTSFRASRVI